MVRKKASEKHEKLDLKRCFAKAPNLARVPPLDHRFQSSTSPKPISLGPTGNRPDLFRGPSSSLARRHNPWQAKATIGAAVPLRWKLIHFLLQRGRIDPTGVRVSPKFHPFATQSDFNSESLRLARSYPTKQVLQELFLREAIQNNLKNSALSF
jgi:hypothetical protein